MVLAVRRWRGWRMPVGDGRAACPGQPWPAAASCPGAAASWSAASRRQSAPMSRRPAGNCALGQPFHHCGSARRPNLLPGVPIGHRATGFRRDLGVPGPARPTLPALWSGDRLLAVPTAGWSRTGHGPGDAVFRPRRALAGDRSQLFNGNVALFVRRVGSALTGFWMARGLQRRRRGRSGCGGRAPNVNNFGKNLALWVIIGLLLVALFNLFQGRPRAVRRRASPIPTSSTK